MGRTSFDVGGVAIAGVLGACVGALTYSAATQPSQAGSLALIAVCAPLAAVALGGARRLLLLLLVVDIPLQWDVNVGYDATAAQIGALGGLNLSVTTIALALLYAHWVADRSASRPELPSPCFKPALPLATYVGICGLSLLVARDIELAGFGLALLLQTLLLFIYVASTVRSASEIRFLAVSLVTALLAESLIICMLRLTGGEFNALGITTRADGLTAADRRLGGTIGSPNTAASFLCLLLPTAAGLLATPLSAWTRRLCISALVFGLAALLVTGSRGGFISLAVSAIIMGYVAQRKGLLAPRAALVGLIAAVVIIVPFLPFIAGRVVGNDQGSAHSRITMAQLAADIIRDNPLLGAGVNNVGQVIPDYAGPEFAGTFVFTIHNKYLLIWAEAGLAALAAFLWFLAATIRRGIRCVRTDDPLVAPLALGMTAGIAGQLVHMGVDIFQSRPQVQLLWFLAAMLAAMLATVRMTPETPPAA